MRPVVLVPALLVACAPDYTLQESVEDAQITDPFSRVHVEVEFGNIQVLGRVDELPEAHLTVTSSWSQRQPTWEATVQGDTLHVTGKCPDQRACGTDVDLRVPPAVEVTVQTKAGWLMLGRTVGDLTGSTRAGDVQVFGHEGTADIETDAGNVALLRSTGSADLWTGAGDVEVVEFRGERLDLETDAGTIYTEDTQAPIVIGRTDSGAIELHLDGALQRVVGETDGGAVLLDVPAGGYRLDLSAEAGTVTVAGVEHVAGADGLLKVQTDAGSIEVLGHEAAAVPTTP